MEKSEMKEAHLNLRKACNDMVCAIRANPSAFRNVRITNASNLVEAANTENIRNVGIIGAAGIFLTKLYLVLGGHI